MSHGGAALQVQHTTAVLDFDKSSTVVEDERHMGVLWEERPQLEKEVKLRNILRETQLYKYMGTMTMDDRERVRDNRDKGRETMTPSESR